MKTLCSVLAMAACIGLFAGCSGHGPYEARTYKPGTTSLEHTEKIVYAQNIRRKVFVVDTNSSVLEDGRLKAYAELENRTGDNLPVMVQTQFRDASGNLSQDETNWQVIVMAPHSSESYSATSLNDKAKDYVIRVMLEERR